MKALRPLEFSISRGRTELQQLSDLLATRSSLKEKEDLLPFFRKRPCLSALCGSYSGQIIRFDRIAWEFDLFGDFSCDILVGDSVTKSYCFVELEDAGARSLFVRQAKKATREWSSRFDHGFSQIVDWFYKLHDRRNSDECEARFGKRSIEFMGLLVVGRDQFLEPGERARLEWRREHCVVYSKRIHCVTFDELLVDLRARLAMYPDLSQPSTLEPEIRRHRGTKKVDS